MDAHLLEQSLLDSYIHSSEVGVRIYKNRRHFAGILHSANIDSLKRICALRVQPLVEFEPRSFINNGILISEGDRAINRQEKAPPFILVSPLVFMRTKESVFLSFKDGILSLTKRKKDITALRRLLGI